MRSLHETPDSPRKHLEEARRNYATLGIDFDEALDRLRNAPRLPDHAILPNPEVAELIRLLEADSEGKTTLKDFLARSGENGSPDDGKRLRRSLRDAIAEALAKADPPDQSEQDPRPGSIPPNWENLPSLPVDLAATLLLCDRSTIYRLAKRGDLTINKRGRVTVKSILDLESRPRE